MRAFEFLTEAKGVFGRKMGDPYIDENGVTASFAGVEMYPDSKPNNGYKDWETALVAINRIQAIENTTIQWVNRQTPQTKAFAIATLTTEEGEKILWGRYYKTVPANTVSSWANNELPSGWSFNSKTAKKARSGLTPQDLIRSEMKFISTDQIMDALVANGAPPEIVDGLRMITLGSMPVFKNSKDKLEGIRDHLGEIISPIAFMSGLIDDANAQSAKNEILKIDYDKCSVYWPQNKNNNLVDSWFIAPNGAKLGISNKGNKGAKASVKNIYDSMIDTKNAELARNNKNAVDIITTIAKNDAKMGPLILGQKLGIIHKVIADEILMHIDKSETDPSKMSDAAKKLFVEYGTKESSPGWNIGYVLLANCAKKVAKKLNEDTAFQESCIAFLNQASIIQIYTDAKVIGNDVHITNFKSVYPPNFSGKIMIDAGKNYTSTIIKGKFSFDIGKGQE